MISVSDTAASARHLLNEGIRGELKDRGLSAQTLRHFYVTVRQSDARFRLSFPSNFASWELDAADKQAINGWAEQLAIASGGSFAVNSDTTTDTGLRRIECSAFSASDLILGVNRTLNTRHQVDASILGHGK